MKKGILFCSLMAASMCAIAQSEVTDYTPGVNAEGVTYFLPRTIVEVTVETVQEVYTPGEFSQYANKYLRLSGVSQTPSTSWQVTALTVTPVGVRDPERGFTVKMRDKSLASLMELNDEGVLLSINEVPTDEAPQLAEPVETPVAAANPKDFLNEEILTTTSTAKMAELVAKEIYTIRESRNAILRGQADNVPKDGEALRIILRNLQEQEDALVAMFKGTTKRTVHETVVQLEPSKTGIGEGVLFRFSRKLGVVSADDLSGTPYYYRMENHTILPQPDEKKASKANAPRVLSIVFQVKPHCASLQPNPLFSTTRFPLPNTATSMFSPPHCSNSRRLRASRSTLPQALSATSLGHKSPYYWATIKKRLVLKVVQVSFHI